MLVWVHFYPQWQDELWMSMDGVMFSFLRLGEAVTVETSQPFPVGLIISEHGPDVTQNKRRSHTICCMQRLLLYACFPPDNNRGRASFQMPPEGICGRLVAALSPLEQMARTEGIVDRRSLDVLDCRFCRSRFSFHFII